MNMDEIHKQTCERFDNSPILGATSIQIDGMHHPHPLLPAISYQCLSSSCFQYERDFFVTAHVKLRSVILLAP